MILNTGQEIIKNKAVDWFYNSYDQVFQIGGAAGTGKSVLIFEILKALHLNDNQYMAMAYTGQAAIVMRTKGFPTARSIHSALFEVVEEADKSTISEHFGVPIKRKFFRKRQYIDPNVQLFFIDEAYMVPENMVRDILSFGIKCIVCGDPNQLPPIGGKPAFLTGSNTHMLTEIMRQAANDPIVYLSHRALSGEPIHNGMYGNKVLVINEEDFDPQMYGLVDVVCTCNNKRREEVNNQIRSMCRYESPLPYYGERIICRNNNWNITYGDIALANGLQGYAYSMPKINAKDSSTFYMDFKPDMCNYVFTDLEMNIEYFNAPYDIKQQMKSLVKSKQNQYVVRGELFEYAYACTVWVLQGGEFNRVMFIEEPVRPQLVRPLIYTAITRAKGLLIYVKRSAKKVYSGF